MHLFIFIFLVVLGFKLGRKIGGECIDCEASLLILVFVFWWRMCGYLDFALQECTWLYSFRVSKCVKVQLFQILEV
jgi:hypothetical protein